MSDSYMLRVPIGDGATAFDFSLDQLENMKLQAKNKGYSLRRYMTMLMKTNKEVLHLWK